jgi:hypothetical protein
MIIESTWESVDHPVLAAAVRYIEDHDWGQLPQAFDLAPMVGLDAEEVGKALLRLDGEYIEASRPLGGLSHVGVDGVHPKARRAVGQWPSPIDLAERVLGGIQEAAESELDEEKRGKLRQTAAFLGSSGKDLFINLLASVIAKSTGIG